MSADPAILREARTRLADAFGARMRGVILFGSQARGDAEPDSDLDLLLRLEGPLRQPNDLFMAVDALYPLVLRMELPIHVVPVDETQYQNGAWALLRRVRQEGVAI